MITEEKYIEEVSNTQANYAQFVEPVLTDTTFREIVINQLITNQYINIYYHSYLIISEAAKTNAQLFYPYWLKFEPLLHHSNSYHRNYAMDLLSILAKTDTEEQFENSLEGFYKRLEDNKISNKKYCIEYTLRILKAKPQLADTIIDKIIASLQYSTNTEKHQNLLLSAFFELLVKLNFPISEKTLTFVQLAAEATTSNKIKRLARQRFNINV